MSEFVFMQGIVDEICSSMINDPHRWQIKTHTLKDLKCGVEYWVGSWDTEITSIWNGHSTDEVFSTEQGDQIREAYERLTEIKASKAQEKVLRSFKNNSKNWWEFWK